MEFGQAFSFAFQDQEWMKKLGLAGVILLIPIVGWLAVSGWMIEITRRVIRREGELLPDWSNFGKYIVDGLLLMIIGFIYTLPTNIINGIMQGANIFLQTTLQNGDSSDAMLPIITGVLICGGCAAFILAILAAFIIPAAYANFAVKGSFGAAFSFGEIFGLIKAAPGAYVLVLLGSILAGFIGMLGIIACIIGVIFTLAYASAIMGNLYGQAYNAATRASYSAVE